MARRVVLFVLGGVLLVIGVLAAIAGGALMALFGSNNTLSSGVQQVFDADPRPGITGQLDSGRIRRADRRWQRPFAYHGHADRGWAPPLPGHRPGQRGGPLSSRGQPRRSNRRVCHAVSPDPGPPRRHRHTTPARISVVLGGQGERNPPGPDVDRYLRLLPGGHDEHRRCRPGSLRRRAGSDHPALVRDRYRPAHRRHSAHPDSDRADRAWCPGPAPTAVPARSRPGSRALSQTRTRRAGAGHRQRDSRNRPPGAGAAMPGSQSHHRIAARHGGNVGAARPAGVQRVR